LARILFEFLFGWWFCSDGVGCSCGVLLGFAALTANLPCENIFDVKERMMKKYLCLAWSITCLMLPHHAMAGNGVSEVEAVGETPFYYRYDAEEIARHEAIGVMDNICEKRGAQSYQGDYVPNSPAFTFTLIKYDQDECVERNGEKKCSIRAKSYCVPKDSLYFSVHCTKTTLLKGKFIVLGGNGGFQLLTNQGKLFSFNSSDLSGKQGKSLISSICENDSGEMISYKKMLRYVHRRIAEHQNDCDYTIERHQKNPKVKVPDSCNDAPQTGAVRG